MNSEPGCRFVEPAPRESVRVAPYETREGRIGLAHDEARIQKGDAQRQTVQHLFDECALRAQLPELGLKLPGHEIKVLGQRPYLVLRFDNDTLLQPTFAERRGRHRDT